MNGGKFLKDEDRNIRVSDSDTQPPLFTVPGEEKPLSSVAYSEPEGGDRDDEPGDGRKTLVSVTPGGRASTSAHLVDFFH